MDTYILGISAYYHDSAAALLRNGVIVAAAQEERFSRLKADSSFPSNSVKYCLGVAGIKIQEVDFVIYYEKPLAKFERLVFNSVNAVPNGFSTFAQALPIWANEKLDLPKIIHGELGKNFRGKLLFAGHHDSHAASAFFPSPFADAAILTLDGVGEWNTSTIGYGSGNRICLTREINYPHSLGLFYSAITSYLGFKVNTGEYKVMGLAPYGSPKFSEIFKNKIIEINGDGSIKLNMEYFNFDRGNNMTSDRLNTLLGAAPRLPESEITKFHLDVAASVQKICDEVVLRSAYYAHELFPSSNIVLAGGIALNCVSNHKVLKNGPFKNIWIQPAAGDAGGAVGAAYLAWHHFLGNPRDIDSDDQQRGSFLGPSYSDRDIGTFLKSTGVEFEHIDDEAELIDRIVELINSQMVVGFFQGRMEFGPRSLGNRSIIGDARSERMQQVMNLKIKFRESFRPFAPSVLQESVSDIFEVDRNLNSPYMLLVAPIRSEFRLPISNDEIIKLDDNDLKVRLSVKRSKFPAITHVDYSARIQTVDSMRNPRYYNLMKKFATLYSTPVFINTSFNIRGEPIVCTFEDAFKCFAATDIDCLVLENHLVLKSSQSTKLLSEWNSTRNRHNSQYKLD